jgi:hypothetical protein
VVYVGENGVYRPTQVNGFGLNSGLELKADTPDVAAKIEEWLAAQAAKIAEAHDA